MNRKPVGCGCLFTPYTTYYAHPPCPIISSLNKLFESFHVFSLVMIPHPLKEFTVCGIIIVLDNDIASQNKELTDDKNDHTNE